MLLTTAMWTIKTTAHYTK